MSANSDRPDSRLSRVSFRASTPVSDRDSEMDQSQHRDASMSLDAESLRDTQPLAFLKGNMSVLGYSSYKGRFGEEK